MTVTLIHGDCLEVLPTLAENSVDAIVCDPPYGLSFMGKDWDHGVPGVHFWEAALRVAKPGAYLLAFGGTRTFHRLTCAIEDAGWEIRDCLMWLYGSGFPKSHDISKAIDKAAGAEREVIGLGKGTGKQNPAWNGTAAGRKENSLKPEYDLTAPATDAARMWDGWGTALKPSVEPIVWAMKPLREVGDCAIIIRNLISMEAELCKHIASIAGSSSPHIQHGLNGARGDSAQMRVPIQAEAAQGNGMAIGAVDGISLEVAISGSTLEAANIALSTISLWRSTLEEALSLARTCTTEMASSLTIDLKTWSLSLSQITLNAIIQAVSNPSGSSVPVSNAARYFNVVSAKLSAIHELIVQGLVSGESKLSPNYQPIVMARKPLIGTVADNVLAWGTGGINVDACRVQGNGDEPNARRAKTKAQEYSGNTYQPITRNGDGWNGTQGRWPANLVLDDESAAMLDEMSGERPSRGEYTNSLSKPGTPRQLFGIAIGTANRNNDYANQTGGASRFFLRVAHDDDEPLRMRYEPKASKRDRDEGLEGMPERTKVYNGQSTNSSKDIKPVEQRFTTTLRNFHPTVKPTSLMRWLVRLVTPPGGVVLDPFCGSGSTGKAAKIEGFSFVGIDTEAEYLEIARRRIEAAQEEMAQMQPALLEVA